MEPQGATKYLAAYRDESNRTPEDDHSQIVGARSISGLNAERKRKIFRHRAEGMMFLLTFPYIGRLRAKFLRPRSRMRDAKNALRGFCFPGSSRTARVPPGMQPASPWEQRRLALGCPRKSNSKSRTFYVLHIC